MECGHFIFIHAFFSNIKEKAAPQTKEELLLIKGVSNKTWS